MCPPLENTGEDLYVVLFATLRSMAAFSRGAPQQLSPDLAGRNFQARRAAIDNAADGRAVTFAESADPQHVSKTVIRHFVFPRLITASSARASANWSLHQHENSGTAMFEFQPQKRHSWQSGRQPFFAFAHFAYQDAILAQKVRRV